MPYTAIKAIFGLLLHSSYSMATIRILLILLVHQSVQAELLEITLDTLLSNMLHLANDIMWQERTSVVDFWFYRTFDSDYMEDFVEKLLVSEPFASQPKVLLDEGVPLDVEFGRAPTLVVVCFGWNEEIWARRSYVWKLFNKISLQTKLIVVVPHALWNSYEVYRYFLSVRLWNVLYIVVNTDNTTFAMYNYIVARQLLQNIGQYHSIEEVFPDQLDLAGNVIVASTHSINMLAEYDQHTGDARGAFVQLVQTIVAHMNGVLKIEFIACDRDEEYSSCSARSANMSKFDFSFTPWTMNESAHCGVAIMATDNLVIIVPRGRRLSVFEMLIEPFNVNAWILIFCIASLCTIVEQRFTIYSFLSEVCKYCNSPPEQKFTNLASLGLTWLMFFVISAYEAKLTSFFTSWPHKPDARTIAELQTTNLKVATFSQYLPDFIIEDPRLNGILLIEQNKTSSFHEEFYRLNSETTGILLPDEFARILLRKQVNYDQENNRPLFVVLEDRLIFSPSFFYFGDRNVLKVRFEELQLRVFQSGINKNWIEMLDQLFEKPLIGHETLYIDLEMLWRLRTLFAILLYISTAVFFIEIVYFHLTRLIQNGHIRRVGRFVMHHICSLPLRHFRNFLRAFFNVDH